MNVIPVAAVVIAAILVMLWLVRRVIGIQNSILDVLKEINGKLGSMLERTENLTESASSNGSPVNEHSH